MDLSIIMINYNAKELTAQAVNSIFAVKPQLSFEIIVVENGGDSEQNFQDMREKITILRGVENNGFGNACNIGAEHAVGKNLLFLNNDTIMHEGTLDVCADYLCRCPQIGVVGARTILADGKLDHACKRGFPTPMTSLYYFMGMDNRYPENTKFGAYRQTFVKDNSISEVDSVSGSFLMMPHAVFEQVGGFDEQFFMYGEDIDLCYRVKEQGYKVIYYGQASLIHLKGQSGLHMESEAVIYHFYDAMGLFYNKHYRQKYGSLTSFAIFLAIQFKYSATIIKLKAKKWRLLLK